MQREIMCLTLLGALALPSTPCEARPAVRKTSAPVPTTAIGISNVVLHLDGDDDIGLAGADLRVLLLERLRERGFNAAGAENLVFGKDESHKAAYRLGGTIRELRCSRLSSKIRCRIGIEWLVLDVARDTIVYKAMVRHAGPEFYEGDVKKLPPVLIRGALDRLIDKDNFRIALAPPSRQDDKPVDSYKEATFARCQAPGKKMPKAAESVLNSTALLRSGDGLGSGVFISADGLLLTAAHVVDGAGIKVKLRDGVEVDASVLRRNNALDVALVKVGRSMAGQPCLETAAALPSVGDELYAAGAPADEKLAFSITKGILSGIRELDGQRKLQTDAAVSPGYSGGPLVNSDGAIAAIITSKLVGKTIEGVAFSAPIRDALAALAITPGATTAPELLDGKPVAVSPPPKREMVIEPEDPTPELSTEEERSTRDYLAVQQWREAERARLSPPWLGRLYTASVAGLVVGGLLVTTGYAIDSGVSDDMGPFAIRTFGWAAVSAGGVGLLVYAAKRPPLPPWPANGVIPPTSPAPAKPSGPSVSLSLRPGGIGLWGSFLPP